MFQISRFSFDESQKIHMWTNFIDIPKGLELKEISIAKEHEFVALFRERVIGKSNEKGYCYLNLLDLDDLKNEIPLVFNDSLSLRDETQVLFSQVLL